MAWTTPRTWVAGELVTEVMMNAHVRDNLNALRDYLIGAQDLGANWQISGSTARELRFQSSAVAHGMTSVVPTDIYGQIFENSAGVGGLRFRGLSEAGADIAVYLVAMTGSASPTTGAVVFDSYKKSGTTVGSLASSEPILDVRNGGTTALRVFGDGGVFITAGLNVGFNSTPAAATVAVNDANLALTFNGPLGAGVPALVFDTGTDAISFYRSLNEMHFTIGSGTPELKLTTAKAIFDGDVEPRLDNAYYSGEASHRWKDVLAVSKTSVLDVSWGSGRALVSVLEGPEYRVYDSGTVRVGAGGRTTVTIDERFYEVVNLSMPWQVTTSGARIRSKDPVSGSFVIEGTPGEDVDWMVMAVRAGFENVRWRDLGLETAEPLGLMDPAGVRGKKHVDNNTSREPAQHRRGVQSTTERRSVISSEVEK